MEKFLRIFPIIIMFISLFGLFHSIYSISIGIFDLGIFFLIFALCFFIYELLNQKKTMIPTGEELILITVKDN